MLSKNHLGFKTLNRWMKNRTIVYTRRRDQFNIKRKSSRSLLQDQSPFKWIEYDHTTTLFKISYFSQVSAIYYLKSIYVANSKFYQTGKQMGGKILYQLNIQIISISSIRLMGNSTEKPPLPSQLNAVNDSRYGGAIMTDKNKTKAYQIFDLDQNNAESFSKLLKTRKQLKHPGLISVNRTWIDNYRENCSFQKMHRLTVQYLYVPENLQDQIKRFCELRRPVPENLVRKYFYNVVSCLEYLRLHGTCHGDIKPKNILISKDKQAFLADSYFINGGRIAFEIVMEDPQSLSLLSPAQLQSLRNKKFVSLKQIHEDEMFAIGLSMMETMTAQPAMQCYDLANLKLKPQFFNRKYSEMIACQYSPQLCQLVMACVEFAPERRIKFSQFVQSISSAQINI